MSVTFTPPAVAKRWACKPETVRKLIEAGVLRGFSVSPPGTRRPHYRITLDAVLAYESGETSKPTEAKPRRSRRRRAECPNGPF